MKALLPPRGSMQQQCLYIEYKLNIKVSMYSAEQWAEKSKEMRKWSVINRDNEQYEHACLMEQASRLRETSDCRFVTYPDWSSAPIGSGLDYIYMAHYTRLGLT